VGGPAPELTSTVRVEVRHRFPVSLRDGFDYITDPGNWPDYWPRFVRMSGHPRWREPGDRAALVLRMAGREVELRMTLGRFEPYRLVEYTSEQSGLPVARHERHFADRDGELDYRIAVEYEPRGGWRSVFDRLVVRRAIERTLRETVANLELRFRAIDGAPEGAG
jgi:hypothetical protein